MGCKASKAATPPRTTVAISKKDKDVIAEQYASEEETADPVPTATIAPANAAETSASEPKAVDVAGENAAPLVVDAPDSKPVNSGAAETQQSQKLLPIDDPLQESTAVFAEQDGGGRVKSAATRSAEQRYCQWGPFSGCVCSGATNETEDFSAEVSGAKYESDTEPLVSSPALATETPQPEAEEAPIRKPTGLFSVELVLMDGDESKSFFIENNCVLGVSFSTDMPMKVTEVKAQSVADAMGIKVGMVLTKVTGQDITTRTVSEVLAIIDESIRDLPPAQLSENTMIQSPTRQPLERKQSEKLMLKDDVYLTGIFSKWVTDFPSGLLEPVASSSSSGTALLKMCVKLTSQSFTFQVITNVHKWKWHLFPRDGKAIRIGFIASHVSKEGLLKAGVKDYSIVGLGNEKLGHGLNFHVIEPPGTVVTVWVQVPARASADGSFMELRTDTADGAQIWYTVEDTGNQLTAGDGMDLSRYKKYLPDDINLG